MLHALVSSGLQAHRRPTPGRFPRLAVCQPEPGPVCGELIRSQAKELLSIFCYSTQKGLLTM